MSEHETGEDDGFESFIQKYEPYLRIVARRQMSTRVRQCVDSMDVVQSAWLYVLRKLGSNDCPDSDCLRPLLVRVIEHRLIDRARQQKSSRRREEVVADARQKSRQAAQTRPSEHAQVAELWQQLLDLCPPQHRQLLERKREGLSLQEIADQTGLHPSSVRRVLYDLAGKLAANTSMPSEPEAQ